MSNSKLKQMKQSAVDAEVNNSKPSNSQSANQELINSEVSNISLDSESNLQNLVEEILVSDRVNQNNEISAKRKEDLLSSLIGEEDYKKHLSSVKESSLKSSKALDRKSLIESLTGDSSPQIVDSTQDSESKKPSPEIKDSKKNSKPEASSKKSSRSDLVSMLAGESELPPVNNGEAVSPIKSQSRDLGKPDSKNPPVAGARNAMKLKKSKTHHIISELIEEHVPIELREEFLDNLKRDIGFYKTFDITKKRTQGDVFMFHWNGRFGNRMHTYAYLHNRAKKFGGKVLLPSDWEGKHLFNLDYEILEDPALLKSVNQSMQPFDSFEYRIDAVREFCDRSPDYNFRYVNPDNPKETYTDYKQGVSIDSVCAYNTKIFEEMSLADTLKLYEFNDDIKNLDLYKRMEDKQGTYDIAHLRRDDISDVNYKMNGGYSVISKDSYLEAFKEYGYDPKNIEWTSDDWTGKWGVGNSISQGTIKARGSWRYPEGSQVLPDIVFDWFPDFLRLYFARTIFRANSSFSFWACTLAKGRETPPKIFAPRLDKRVLYAKEDTFKQETKFHFEEGNHPHWLCISGKDNCDDIVFSDEPKPKKR